MSLSWNILAQSKPSWKGSEPSLGTSIFELSIKFLYSKFFCSCFFFTGNVTLFTLIKNNGFSLRQKAFLLKMGQKLVFFWKCSGKKEKKILASKMQIFKPIFDFWAERAQPGWAENPSARLGLITSKQYLDKIFNSCHCAQPHHAVSRHGRWSVKNSQVQGHWN